MAAKEPLAAKIERFLALPLVVYVALVIYLVLSYVPIVLDQATVDTLVQEDGYFEMVGALGFFAASVAFVVMYSRSRHADNPETGTWVKRLAYLLLAVVFLFFAGEEISWGQRFLGIETPEAIREINSQDELSVHNLTVFQTEDLNFIRFLGIFPIDRIFSVFWFTFALVIPSAAAIYAPARRWLNRFVPVPDLSIGLLFAANYIVQKAFRRVPLFWPDAYLGTLPLVASIDEIKEGNIGLLFALLALVMLFRELRPRPDQSPQL